MMCLTSELTAIFLLLLTFLFTTLPPTTTTTTATATTTTTTTTTTAITINAATNMQSQQQQQPKQQQLQLQQYYQQQSQLMPAESLALVNNADIEIASAGTQLLPRDDSLLAALVNNHNSHSHNGNGNTNSNNNYNNILNMEDYNALDAAQMAAEDETFPPPVFDFGMPRNITARSGQTAAINCRVEHLGDKSVSWIRKRDLHILTAGILTYTSDERFKVIRTADSKIWSLHVKYAQPRDSGIYECQVNTEPKISMAFRLNVIVTPPDAKAIIAGPADLYVKVGSAITLTCHVKQPSSAQDIGPIYWYRGPYILTPFVAHPNEAAIDLQRISMESKLGEKLQSRLRIANAQTNDSGNYTCMPTTAEAASVVVNVINDESPAAMQKSAAAHTAHEPTLAALIITAASNTAAVVRWCGRQLKQQQQQQQQHNRWQAAALAVAAAAALSCAHISRVRRLKYLMHDLYGWPS